jgi:hypothetical protein
MNKYAVPAKFKPRVKRETIYRLRKSLDTLHETISEIKGYAFEEDARMD